MNEACEDNFLPPHASYTKKSCSHENTKKSHDKTVSGHFSLGSMGLLFTLPRSQHAGFCHLNENAPRRAPQNILHDTPDSRRVSRANWEKMG